MLRISESGLSYVIYKSDGLTQEYPIKFKYLAPEHIQVKENNTIVPTDKYHIDNSYVKFSYSPSGDGTISISRHTSVQKRLATFSAGSALTESLLNLAMDHFFLFAQEIYDLVRKTLTLNLETNTLDAENFRISNVGDPLSHSDAINFKFLTKSLLNLVKSGALLTIKPGENNWDAAEKRIVNLLDPVNPKDAVNKNYLDTHMQENNLLPTVSSTDKHDVLQINDALKPSWEKLYSTYVFHDTNPSAKALYTISERNDEKAGLVVSIPTKTEKGITPLTKTFEPTDATFGDSALVYNIKNSDAQSFVYTPVWTRAVGIPRQNSVLLSSYNYQYDSYVAKVLPNGPERSILVSSGDENEPKWLSPLDKTWDSFLSYTITRDSPFVVLPYVFNITDYEHFMVNINLFLKPGMDLPVAFLFKLEGTHRDDKIRHDLHYEQKVKNTNYDAIDHEKTLSFIQSTETDKMRLRAWNPLAISTKFSSQYQSATMYLSFINRTEMKFKLVNRIPTYNDTAGVEGTATLKTNFTSPVQLEEQKPISEQGAIELNIISNDPKDNDIRTRMIDKMEIGTIEIKGRVYANLRR